MANTIFYVADGNGTREANEQEVQMILDGQAKQEEEFQKNLITVSYTHLTLPTKRIV